MDGWMDGRMDGWKEGRKEGREAGKQESRKAGHGKIGRKRRNGRKIRNGKNGRAEWNGMKMERNEKERQEWKGREGHGKEGRTYLPSWQYWGGSVTLTPEPLFLPPWEGRGGRRAVSTDIPVKNKKINLQ